MRNITELLGLPIVVRDANTPIGIVQTIFMRRDLRSIAALGLRKPNLLSHGERYVVASDIVAYGQSAISVHNEQALRIGNPEPQWLRHRSLINMQIVNLSSKRFGSLSNLVIDKGGFVAQLRFERASADHPLKQFGYIVRDAVTAIDAPANRIMVDTEMALDLQRQMT